MRAMSSTVVLNSIEPAEQVGLIQRAIIAVVQEVYNAGLHETASPKSGKARVPLTKKIESDLFEVERLSLF